MISSTKNAIKTCKIEKIKKLIEGEIINGKIICKNNKFIIVDIGFRSDVRIYEDEIWNYSDFNINQLIDVYIEQFDSKTGETLASRKLISIEEAWAILYNAWSTDSWIIGEVLSLAQEGYVIKVLGLIALLSSDLTDEQYLKELDIGKTDKFKVFEIDRDSNFILLNKPIEKDKEEKEPEYKINVGDVVLGVVNDILPDEIIVDLGIQEGVIKLDKIAWYDALVIIKNIKCGYLIKNRCCDLIEQKNIYVLEFEHIENNDNKGGLVYGLVNKIDNNHCETHISKRLKLPILFSSFDEKDIEIIKKEVKRGDIIKLLPVLADFSGSIYLDLDVDGLKYLKFVMIYEGETIKGIIVNITEDSAIIALSKEIFGELRFNTLIDKVKLKQKLKQLIGLSIYVKICDFNPEYNKIYLALSNKNNLKIEISDKKNFLS
ncbi:MAG: hypothetical protein ACKESC_01270 [Candidatus Hodgkinia cicadicola]